MEIFGFTWLNILISIAVASYCPVLLELKKLHEYNVIGDNGGLDTMSSKASSLDENSLEDNQINISVNPGLINNFKPNTNYRSKNDYRTEENSNSNSTNSNSSFNNSLATNNQSTVELNMNRINCLTNYE